MDQKLLRFNPFLNELEEEQHQQLEILPDSSCRSPFLVMKTETNKIHLASSSPKRRRAVQKRVISVPIGDLDGSKQKGEGAPPSDSWAWRKYGQKPIKGSPYPRGYYRCSSSKGCPARKQVERSRSDPSMLVVTYACEHNHPRPASRNPNTATGPTKSPLEETETAVFTNPPEIETEEKLELEDGFLADDFCWFPDVNSPAKEGLLHSPIYTGNSDEILPEEKYGEDESFFADLGELPECSVVFRRGFLEFQEEENRRCSLRTASWCGSTG